MSGYHRSGSETISGHPSTRYSSTASSPDQIMKVLGIGDLKAAGSTEVGKLLGQYLAKTAKIEEVVWVDHDGHLSQAILDLTNNAGQQSTCQLFKGGINFSVTDVKIDESVHVETPTTEKPTGTSTTVPPGSDQSSAMAQALKGCVS
jgi:hypothetical protein